MRIIGCDLHARPADARSHCAGLCIQRRIMLALRFIKPLLVPGKFVPEAVEIDALSAGDQALHVLTTEAKVPHGRILCGRCSLYSLLNLAAPGRPRLSPRSRRYAGDVADWRGTQSQQSDRGGGCLDHYGSFGSNQTGKSGRSSQRYRLVLTGHHIERRYGQ